MRVDLNSDLGGESFGRYRLGLDERVMEYITSANVATGWHAGDPLVMRKTVRLAKERGGGGRRPPGLSRPSRLREEVHEANPPRGSKELRPLPDRCPLRLHESGGHQAPARQATRCPLQRPCEGGEELARAVIEGGITDFDRNLIFVTLSGSKAVEIAGGEMGGLGSPTRSSRTGLTTRTGRWSPAQNPGGR